MMSYEMWHRTLPARPCRVSGHQWQQYNARTINGGFIVLFRCLQCKATKSQTWDRQGRVLWTEANYSAPRRPTDVAPAPSRAEVNRLWRIKNLKEWLK